MALSPNMLQPQTSRPVVTNAVSIPGLQQLWTETLGDPRICIAVLDGPVDLSHPSFLGANLAQLATTASGPTSDGPALQHGTHVASVIFGRHDSPVKGIAPNCRGLIVPVFKDGEDGTVVPCSQVELARAITQAIQTAEKEDASALVINVSGGQFSPSGQAHPILADVVRNCNKNRILIVAAAGNQGCECLHLPGAIPSVLAVGAMKLDGDPLDFSNWGQIYREQGVLAPGENILGALPSGGTTAGSGTSFATAIVSGVAALLLSLQLKRRRETSADTVGQGILQSALGCEHQPVNDCRRLLAGRLHIPGAISAIIQGANEMSRVAEATVNGSVPSQPPPVFEPKLDPQVAVAPSPQPSVDNLAPFTPSANLMPSACGCGGKSGPAQLVYALGKLSFDYGTRARRAYFSNAFFQALKIPASIDSPSDLLRYLAQAGVDKPQIILNGPRFANRSDITSIIWTLSIDDTPVYAIVPSDAFAFEVYDGLLEFLQDQVDEQKCSMTSRANFSKTKKAAPLPKMRIRAQSISKSAGSLLLA
jgi:hypothetical protein